MYGEGDAVFSTLLLPEDIAMEGFAPAAVAHLQGIQDAASNDVHSAQRRMALVGFGVWAATSLGSSATSRVVSVERVNALKTTSNRSGLTYKFTAQTILETAQPHDDSASSPRHMAHTGASTTDTAAHDKDAHAAADDAFGLAPDGRAHARRVGLSDYRVAASGDPIAVGPSSPLPGWMTNQEPFAAAATAFADLDLGGGGGSAGPWDALARGPQLLNFLGGDNDDDLQDYFADGKSSFLISFLHVAADINALTRITCSAGV